MSKTQEQPKGTESTPNGVKQLPNAAAAPKREVEKVLESVNAMYHKHLILKGYKATKAHMLKLKDEVKTRVDEELLNEDDSYSANTRICFYLKGHRDPQFVVSQGPLLELVVAGMIKRCTDRIKELEEELISFEL